MVPAVLPGSLASNGASNAAARKYCRAHRIAWPSPCKPLAWSLTGHLWCSVAKLLMIIPGCYSRVSWVLSSDSDSFPGPGQDPYRRRFPLPRRLIRNGSHPVHSLLTSNIRVTLTGEEVRHCRELAYGPAFTAPQRVMEARLTCRRKRGIPFAGPRVHGGQWAAPGSGGRFWATFAGLGARWGGRRAPGSGGLAEVASGPHSLARGALGWWADEATLRPPAPRTRRPGGDCTSGGSSPIGTVAP